MAKVDQQFGKVFDELCNIAAYITLHRQMKKSATESEIKERGKTAQRKKSNN